MNDEETCRICRGEATDLEPLYHPCKCSGSIRYVHQDCLLDWLYHTHKSTNAVCELCSTPFKFSKVYSSDMPDAVPILVIVKKLFQDAFKLFGTINRLGLLYVLWIVVCPYISIMTLRFYLSLAEAITSQPSNIGNLYDLIKELWALPEDAAAAAAASNTTTNALSDSASPSTQPNPTAALGYLVKKFFDSIYETVFGHQSDIPELVPWMRKLRNDVFRGQELMVFLCLFVLIFVMVREWILQSGVHIQQQLAREALIQAQEVRAARRAAGLDAASREPNQAVEQELEANAPRMIEEAFNALLQARTASTDAGGAPPGIGDLRAEALAGAQEQANAEAVTQRPEHVQAAIGRMNEQMLNPALLDQFNLPPEENEDGEEEAGGFFDILFDSKGISTIITISIAGNLFMTTVNFFLFFIPYLIGRVLLIFVYWIFAPRIYAFSSASKYGIYFVFETLLQSARNYLALPDSSSSALTSNIEWSKSMVLESISQYNTPWDIPQSGFAIRLAATCLGYALYVGSIVFLANSVSIPWATPSTTRIIVGMCAQIQAIMKVITIVGIELVIFPIFGGTLLRVALLPLFENGTVMQAIEFTINNPITSTLIHWTLGTIYMILFAMFVTVCRKLMRPGVLFFIRDPKDPTFHPIGDILERPLRSQLHKIGLSGVIYAFLILVCLGSGVQLLRLMGIIPLNFKTNLTSLMTLEISLSFACILTFIPVLINISDELNFVSKVWKVIFDKSCRLLRLSSFILGKTNNDEIVVAKGKIREDKVYLDEPQTGGKQRILTVQQLEDYNKAEGGYLWPADRECLLTDGVFVRAPPIDRIPILNKELFTPVDAEDRPLNKPFGSPTEKGPNELSEYVVVFRPPHFRLRIAALLLTIWFFGVILCSILAVSPLIFGKLLTRAIFPTQVYEGMCDWIYILYGAPISVVSLHLLENWRTTVSSIKNSVRYLLAEPDGPTILGLGFTVVLCGPYLLGIIVKHQFAIIKHPENDPYFSEEIGYMRQYTHGLTALALGRLVYNYLPESRFKVYFQVLKESLWTNHRDWNRMWRESLRPLLQIYLMLDGVPLVLSDICVTLLHPDDHDANHVQSLKALFFEVPKLLGVAFLILRWSFRRLVTFAASARDSAYLVGEQLENM